MKRAIVAVGGECTINAVARAADAQGSAMGVVPHGTFNYFARAHGIPTETVEATTALRAWVVRKPLLRCATAAPR